MSLKRTALQDIGRTDVEMVALPDRSNVSGQGEEDRRAAREDGELVQVRGDDEYLHYLAHRGLAWREPAPGRQVEPDPVDLNMQNVTLKTVCQ